jgi:hypothetical protein
MCFGRTRTSEKRGPHFDSTLSWADFVNYPWMVLHRALVLGHRCLVATPFRALHQAGSTLNHCFEASQSSFDT